MKERLTGKDFDSLNSLAEELRKGIVLIESLVLMPNLQKEAELLLKEMKVYYNLLFSFVRSLQNESSLPEGMFPVKDFVGVVEKAIIKFGIDMAVFQSNFAEEPEEDID